MNILYLKEALRLEMNYNNKRVIVSVIYRFHSQNNIEFVQIIPIISKEVESVFTLRSHSLFEL